MQREIKFRAWDKKFRFMVYSPSPDLVIFLDGTICIGEPCEATDNFELMQFTGLKDKNGVEIYEGDIVKEFHERKNLTIIWDTHHCAFVAGNRWVKHLREYGNSGNPFYCGNCEVVGNIYQNPELLEAK